MRILLILFFAIRFCYPCVAQKQANIWYFAKYLGLNFNSSPPTLLSDGQVYDETFVYQEAAASISDENGVLLFYTDGIQVWNKHHQRMPNGFGLFGSGTTTQTLIVPKPGADNLYYIFTASPQGNDDLSCCFARENNGFNYSIVDLDLENGLGDLVEKNVLLVKSTTEKMAGTFHANGKDIWVVMHEWGNSVFRSFLVTSTGINTSSITSKSGTVHGPSLNRTGALDDVDAIGQMKFSPNSEKLALTLSRSNQVEVFNFDASNGKITEFVHFSHISDFRLYGVEFSQSGRFLYVSDGARLIYQFDLFAHEIYGSKVVLGDYLDFQDNPAQLQLATDGKIYVAKYDMVFIGAIHFPDKAGKDCEYEREAIQIPIDGKRVCKGGLPNFISTYFYKPELYPPSPIFQMPNVFTPNADEFNPKFVPIKMYYVMDIELKIFNRWGQIVYQTSNIEQGWDGANSPSGVYYWKVDYVGVNSKNYSQKGFVSLLGGESVN